MSRKHKKQYCENCEEWVTAVPVAWYSELLQRMLTRLICAGCGGELDMVLDEGEAETYGELPY